MSAKTADTQQRSPRSTIFTWRTTTPTPRPFSSSTTRDISNSTILILQVCYSSAAHRTPVQRLVTTHGKDFNDQQWKLNLCRNITDSKISPYCLVCFEAGTDDYEMWPQTHISTISFSQISTMMTLLISLETHMDISAQLTKTRRLSRFV